MNSFPGAGGSLKDRPISLRGSHNCDVGFDRSGKIKSDYLYEQTLLNNP